MKLLAPCAFLALALPSAAQTSWFVDASAPGPGTGTVTDPYQSLQFAIDAATTVPGDTLDIASGTYTETITPRGKDLIFSGSNAASAPIIDGQGGGSVLTVDSGETFNCLFRDLVFTGGTGTPDAGGNTRGGGAIIRNSGASFESVVFRGNSAFQGGGLMAVNGITLYDDCTVENNQAEAGGGIYAISSDVIYTGGSISNNLVDASAMEGFGGGVYVGSISTTRFEGVTFSQNRTLYNGGGAGIYTSEFAFSTDVNDCLFEGNEPGLFNGPGAGGAILSRAALFCIDSRFVGNGQITEEGTTWGGAVNGGSYTNCEFIGNGAQTGGAMHGATASSCLFQNNSACAGSAGKGGAASDSVLSDCDIIGNYVCGRGGGVFGGSLQDCRVQDNFAYFGEGGTFSEGGGVHSTIATDTLIEGNRCALRLPFASTSRGGGAFESDLTGCTVLSNRASIGGGVYGGSAVRSTLSGNLGQTRSGAAEGGVFDSCILWHNFPADAADTGTFAYSNVESGFAPGTGNLSANPLFFGGSAADVHLQPGSPSIGTGNPGDMGSLPFDPLWMAAPATYCQSTPTFVGCTVEIEAPNAAPLGTGFTVRALGGPSASFGLLFMGTQPNYQTVPGSGTARPNSLCVGGAVTRTAAIQSTSGAGPCDGEYTKVVAPAELLAAGVQAGDSLYAQFWFRQPPTSTGFVGSAMSNAVFLPIGP